MNAKIGLADINEIDEVKALLKEAAEWLKERKIQQWSYLLEGGEDEEIIRSIQAGNTYVMKIENVAVGTFTLAEEQNEWDQDIWGKLDDQAAYLHRFAVKQTFIGSGIGAEMLVWMEKLLQEQHIPLLRLDCVEHNVKLNEFYQRNGFIREGIQNSHCKYEKKILL